MTDIEFDCIAMQGGGVRCFWQAGFLDVAGRVPRLRDVPIYAVSAAAGIAAAFAVGRLTHAIEQFRAAAAANPSNFHWRNLGSRKPLIPHAGIYRRVLDDVFDVPSLPSLQAGPGLFVLLARPRPGLPTPLVVALAGALYRAKRSMHAARWSQLVRGAGFRPEFVDMRTCLSPDEVARLVLASSCTPPFTPVLSWDGRRVIDGGLLETVPISPITAAGRRALILMTRAPRADETFVQGHAVVWPSRPLTVSAWDYTDPQAVDAAVALGRADATAFMDRPQVWR